MKDKVIIFFTRIPTLGMTKTRLEPFLGKETCVKLQTAFIKDIYNNIKNIGVDVLIYHSDHGDLEDLKKLTDKNKDFFEQKGSNLGEKMHNAISSALKEYRKAVLIGSDIPLVNKSDIETAFDILETKDIVISPGYDGGYYLVGMKEETKEIFNIKYSTSSVFQETIDKIEDLGKSYGSGRVLLDIDDKDDFLRLYDILKKDRGIPCDNTRKLVNKIIENRDEDE